MRDKRLYNNKQLAQLRPSDTDTVVILNPIDKSRVIVYTVNIANTTASGATLSLFHDKDGTTFNESTALLFDFTIPANETLKLFYEDGIGLTSQDNLAIRAGTANAITVTLYGIEFSDSGN